MTDSGTTSEVDLSSALEGRSVTLLETRRSAEMAALVRRYGGEPIVVPALREVESADSSVLVAMLDEAEQSPPAAVIFQTGVGVRYLFHSLASIATDADARMRRVLEKSVVIARGPKPTAALGGLGIRLDRSVASPFTTREIIAEVDSIDVASELVLVQQHGARNAELVRSLELRGAKVQEIEVYHWEMPEDTAPLSTLIRSIIERRVDIVTFTSASQVEHLFVVAETLGQVEALREGLNNAPLVAAVGPVCFNALTQYGVAPANGVLQPRVPKMAPLVKTIAQRAAGVALE